MTSKAARMHTASQAAKRLECLGFRYDIYAFSNFREVTNPMFALQSWALGAFQVLNLANTRLWDDGSTSTSASTD